MTQTGFELGDEVRDTVTGFQGIAIGWHKWYTGCDTVSIQPPVSKDGKVPDSQTFDVIRLALVKAKKAPSLLSGLGAG